MGLRKVSAITNTVNGEVRVAITYRDAEWQEYRVKFYRDGVYQVEADYHDTDKQSALDTATSFCTAPATVVKEETGEEMYL